MLLKGRSLTKNFYSVPALLTPLPLIPFTTEELTGCTNEAAKGANKALLNFLFHVLLFTNSIN